MKVGRETLGQIVKEQNRVQICTIEILDWNLGLCYSHHLILAFGLKYCLHDDVCVMHLLEWQTKAVVTRAK